MKRRYELEMLQVDAFTDVPYGGNPAVVFLDADRVSDDTMIKVAREVGTKESVFVSRSKKAAFTFRYMTPSGEIDFSGHPTIAALHALVEKGAIEVVSDITMLNLETKSGILAIEIVKNETSQMHEIQITHKQPQFLTTYDPIDIAEALGLTLADIMSPNPIQTVSTGIPTLVVPIVTMRSMDRMKPDMDRLEQMCREGDYDSILVFTKETKDVTSDAHARHFAPRLGVPEDPVSGAGAAVMASYMVKYGIMDSTNPVTSIIIEQGHFVNRPGKVIVEVRAAEDTIEQVKVSGTAVTVLRGLLLI
jgi:PhzF family phenazine biosynthesis protein